MSTPGTRPLRADAQRNRDRLLEVAVRAFSTEGPEVTLEAVAKEAGVGIGTLYRHFPTREALVLAVYRSEVDRLLGQVDPLLEAHPPLEALRAWILDLVEAMRRKHGLGDALSPAAHDAVAQETYDPVVEAFTRLLDAGKAAGMLRDDADPRDLVQFTSALWRAAPERTEPMVDLLIDGLKT